MYTKHSQEPPRNKQQTDVLAMSSVLTIGNFDGYHLGHQKILERLGEIAQEMSLPSYIVTFEPNPKLFFNKEFSFLQTPAQRLSSLRSSGVNGIYVIDFAKAHLLSGEEFISQFLIKRFGLTHLVVGEDFRFGKNRAFSLEMLQAQLATQNIQCTVIEQVPFQDEPISSSRIRAAVKEGLVEKANQMLGREYVIEGIVVKGEGLGSVIGFPTINIETENTLYPRGVFITKTMFAGNSSPVWGVTNIGNRPTVRGTKETVETHLINFRGNLYHQVVSMTFCKKIRDEAYFDSIHLLREQIGLDVKVLHAFIDSQNFIKQ